MNLFLNYKVMSEKKLSIICNIVMKDDTTFRTIVNIKPKSQFNDVIRYLNKVLKFLNKKYKNSYGNCIYLKDQPMRENDEVANFLNKDNQNLCFTYKWY